MKQGLIVIATVLYLCSCNNAADNGYQKSKPDTIRTTVTLVTPLDWQKVGILGDETVNTHSFRLTKDTLIFDSTDTNTLTKKWKRDTSYLFEIHYPPKDTTNGKKDSVIHITIPSKFILVDFNKDPNYR